MDRPCREMWPAHLLELEESQEILDATTGIREELEREDEAESSRSASKEGKQPLVWCDCANPQAGTVDGRCPDCRGHIKLCGDCAGILKKECNCREEDW
jgi:hypothetical protein